jgi:hypothetical protein
LNVNILEDLTTAHFPEEPGHSCDLVMKGGITSGVVYPYVVCELAKTFKFENIGGTSAGAIAAACTAAAELGRASTPKSGFNKLAELKAELSSTAQPKYLFKASSFTGRIALWLFQAVPKKKQAQPKPQEELGWIGHALIFAKKLGHMLWTILKFAAGPALLLALALAIRYSHEAIVVKLMFVLAVALFIAGWFVKLLLRAITSNGFGLCSGMSQSDADPALTQWLDAKIREFSNLPENAESPHVLTFGELDDAGINLEMVTTNLTRGLGMTLPLNFVDASNKPDPLGPHEHEYFFSKTEWERLFPKHVVAAMTDLDSLPEWCDADDAQMFREAGLYPLPSSRGLPVLVATRMSLSFPILLSAVPLYGFDRADRPPDGSKPKVGKDDLTFVQGKGLVNANGIAIEHPEKHLDGALWQQKGDADLAAAQWRGTLRKMWFSDGGMSSNLPINIFDSALPQHPTFAINLDPYSKMYPEHPGNEELNVAVATTNTGNFKRPFRPIGGEGIAGILSFAGAIIRTMKDRNDTSLITEPGFRERIATVHLADDEGGLNLAMDAELIKKLVERGQWAGLKLADNFTPQGDDVYNAWTNHRWVRLRSYSIAVGKSLAQFAEAWEAGASADMMPSYASLATSEKPGPYSLETETRRDALVALAAKLVEAGELFDDLESEVSHRPPRPAPSLRIGPHEDAPPSKSGA